MGILIDAFFLNKWDIDIKLWDIARWGIFKLKQLENRNTVLKTALDIIQNSRSKVFQ